MMLMSSLFQRLPNLGLGMQIPSPRLVFLSFVLCMLSQAESIAQLERVDGNWYIGNQQTTISDIAGITRIEFRHPGVDFHFIDSVSPFRFSFGNNSYTWKGVSLQSNGCGLVRELVDVLESHADFDNNTYIGDFCTRPFQGAGTFPRLLPVGNGDRLLYLSDVFSDPTGRRYFISGLGATYLDASVLDSPDPLGQGSATIKRFSFPFQDSMLRETNDCISDGEGGWFCVYKSEYSGRLHVLQMTEDTILRHSVQDFGIANLRDQAATRLRFRPQGDAFVITKVDGYTGPHLYWFDRETAEISYWDSIPKDFDATSIPFRGNASDCEWSACGRFLYITSQRHIFQFDTEAPDIAASMVQLNDTTLAIPERGFFELERGPDCRIYASFPGGSQIISVIDKPSEPGLACDLKYGGMYLRRYYFASLPNHADYSLWARDRVARGLHPVIDTQLCDASIPAYNYHDWNASSISETLDSEDSGWHLAPNPARAGGRVELRFEAGSEELLLLSGQEELDIRLTDAVGREQLLKASRSGVGGYGFHLPVSLSAGLYGVSLYAGDRVLGTTMLVVQ